MNNSTSKFELPRRLDHYLAALSKLYAEEGQGQKQEILVNSRLRVHEAWSSDNWNGGTYGHALYFALPEQLYLPAIRQKRELETQLKEDINRIQNIQGEFIEEVFLEMEVSEDGDWRKDSNLLVVRKRMVPADATKRIWGEGGFRLFLSHKSEAKKETSALKDRLRLFGVCGFVAHEDIHPTKEWQDEIENALVSMDGFVALMTKDFHDSEWTDQEVGFALARRVPIIAVRLGKNPYGFIGKFQGLSSTWSTCAEDLVKILINNDRMFDAYVQALRECPNWDGGNILAKALPGIERLSQQQIDELVLVYNETAELQGSFGFNGSRTRLYGSGLASHLNRLGDRQFRFAGSGLIEVAS
jgi:hypothetical protein